MDTNNNASRFSFLLALVAIVSLVMSLVPQFLVEAEAAPNTGVTHNLYIVYASTQSISGKDNFLPKEHLDALVQQSSEYWVRETNGAIAGIVHNWNSVATWTIPSGTAIWGNCSNDPFMTLAFNHASTLFPGVAFGTGLNPQPLNHLVIIVKSNDPGVPAPPYGCSGLATRPSVPSVSGGGVLKILVPDVSIKYPYNNDLMYPTPKSYGQAFASTLAHEFGHNLGLGHAGKATCTAPAYDGVFSGAQSTCSIGSGYDDKYDVMGNDAGSLSQALSGFRRGQLGLLTSGLGRIVINSNVSQTVTLAPLEDQDYSRANEILVTDPSNTSLMYSIEFRKAKGVRVLRVIPESPGSPTTGYTTAYLSPSLVSNQGAQGEFMRQGDAFTSMSGQVKLTVATLTNSSATLSLQVGSFSFSLGASSWSISSASAASTSISVVSNVSWNASSSATWLTFNPLITNGYSGSIVLSAAKNVFASSRSATVTIVASTGGQVMGTITVMQPGASPTLTLSESSWVVSSYREESLNVFLNSNSTWSASSSASWLTVTPSSGVATIIISGSITFDVATNLSLSLTENPGTSARSATLTFTTTSGSPAVSRTIVVQQAPRPPTPTLNLGVTYWVLQSDSQASISVPVTSNTTWSVRSDVDWLTANASGTGNGSFMISATQNNTQTSREAIVRVGTNGPGNVFSLADIYVYQPVRFSILDVPNAVTVGANGVMMIWVGSNSSWSVSSSADWLKVTPTSGSGSMWITINPTNNPSTSPRSATVTMKTTSGTLVTRVIAVTQEGALRSFFNVVPEI